MSEGEDDEDTPVPDDTSRGMGDTKDVNVESDCARRFPPTDGAAVIVVAGTIFDFSLCQSHIILSLTPAAAALPSDPRTARM